MRRGDRLVEAGAPIDAFGVATAMSVSADAPALDIAYKLTEYAGKGRMKLSSGKRTLPAESKSPRTDVTERESIRFRRMDVVEVAPPSTWRVHDTCRHHGSPGVPSATWKPTSAGGQPITMLNSSTPWTARDRRLVGVTSVTTAAWPGLQDTEGQRRAISGHLHSLAHRRRPSLR